MAKRYLDTSFSDFLKHKLYEIAKAEQPQEEKDLEEEITDKETAETAQEDSEDDTAGKTKKKEHKVGSKEYMDDWKKEFEEIINGYDNLYRNENRR